MSRRVLIVDKQPETVRLLRAVFDYMDESWDVISVPSGEEALLEMRFHPVDFLICEVRLPGMNGYELVDQLRRLRPDLKAVVLTQNGQTIPVIANSQADRLITKPLDPETIGTLLAEVLGQPSLSPTDENREGQFEQNAAEEADESTTAGEQSSSGLIADLLSGLRQDLDAHSVGMLSDSGQIGLQAGDFPEIAQDGRLMQAMMAVFSAGQRISQIIEKATAENLLQFAGKDYHLVMAQVGISYALVVFLHADKAHTVFDRLPTLLRPVLDDLLLVLNELGVPLAQSQSESAAPALVAEVDQEAEPDSDDDTLDDKLGALFDSAEADSGGDLDSFWEPGDDPDDSTSLIGSDALSYQQAQQLGLTPPEDAEEV